MKHVIKLNREDIQKALVLVLLSEEAPPTNTAIYVEVPRDWKGRLEISDDDPICIEWEE